MLASKAPWLSNIWTLARDSPVCAAGAVPELVNLLAPAYSASERLEAAHALSSLASGNAEVAHIVVAHGAVLSLAALLDCTELAARHAAASCLAELVDQPDLRVCRQSRAPLHATSVMPLFDQTWTMKGHSGQHHAWCAVNNACSCALSQNLACFVSLPILPVRLLITVYWGVIVINLGILGGGQSCIYERSY